MSDFYDNLLKATDNTSDITTEKYGVITKISGTLCSVKEYDSDLEHSNVPIVNGEKLEVGDKVIIGFLNNSIYDTVCYGVLDRQIETNWEDIKDKPTTFPTNWENIEDKPTTFPPTSHNHISSEITDLINTIYPVGSIYMSVSNTSPSILFGGTWEQIKDKFLLSSGDTYSNGSTGGEEKHTLTVNEMPSHRHSRRTSPLVFAERDSSKNEIISPASGSAKAVTKDSDYTGGGQAHNNMPPYLAVNVWKRTA